MVALYWTIGVVAYFAIAVVIMRWRTRRINQCKPWRLFMIGERPTEKEQELAHSLTTAVGLFWPVTVVIPAFVDAILIGVWFGWQLIDWTMRKIARLPPRQ